MDRKFISDASRVEKKCHLSRFLTWWVKMWKKYNFLLFLYCRSSPTTAHWQTAHNKFVQNTCKPMPLCFQIWQVSAKYCTFLDFLAHCWVIYQLCYCELRIYVLRTSSTGYSLDLKLFTQIFFYQLQCSLKKVKLPIYSSNNLKTQRISK